MIIAIILYFGVASAALALLLLPQARAQALLWARRLISSGVAARRAAATHGQRGAGRVGRTLGAGWDFGVGSLVRYWRWMVAALFVLTAAPLLSWALRGWIGIEGYDHRWSHPVNEHVAELLRGEQLVPPLPLPPEFFTTAEVEQARPYIHLASRQWELLNPDFRQRLLVVFKLMHEQRGYELVLLEGYRSPERQAKLAELGPQTTRAGAFESWHQYGLAADCAFLRDGRIVISEQDPWAARGYAAYGEIARSVGFQWGGDWRSIKDYGHVELRVAGVMQRRSGAEQPTAPLAH